MRSWVVSRVFRQLASAVIVGAVYVFLFAPLVIVVGSSFDGTAGAFVNFPPKSVSLVWYGKIKPEYFQTLRLSLLLGGVASVLGVILGVPAALGLVRSRIGGKEMIAGVFRAPLQIPHVVTGVAFLQVYYLTGDLFGLHVAGSFLGLVIGHMFVSTPYVVGAVVAVLQQFDMSLEEAALSLGATRWSTFRRVTLPIIMPGVYAGGLYAFIVSFGDVPVSLFLASPKNMTFPVELFYGMEYDFDPSILAISTLILVGSFILLSLLQRAVGLGAVFRSGGSG